jgi:hypothetical protein
MPADHRLRHAVFVGINLGALLLIYGAAIKPVVGLFAGQADHLIQARAAFEHARDIASHRAAAQEAAERASTGPYTAAFLPGVSDGAINAGLQSRLKAIADQAGARVQSVRAVEPRMEDGIRHIGAHLELAGPIAAIRASLETIEESEPYLFVDTLSLRMPAAPPGFTPAQEPALEAQIDIYGPVWQTHAASH